ncbi:hypothetical protein Hanom_Chr09g00795301 [Helianthus anomalus]
MSYTTSSYILERIIQIPAEENEYEKKNINKGKGSEYNQVPPPMMGNYCHCDYAKVEKTLNIKLKSFSNEVDQLADDIDVIYTKSDVSELEFVNDVVEKVFYEENQNDSTKNENSKS